MLIHTRLLCPRRSPALALKSPFQSGMVGARHGMCELALSMSVAVTS